MKTLIENLRVEKNKQKNFFNQMTHEFRTPLTTIIGYADLLKKLDSGQEREECTKYIISESKRLLRMVDDILSVINADDLYLKPRHKRPPIWMRRYGKRCRS